METKKEVVQLYQEFLKERAAPQAQKKLRGREEERGPLLVAGPKLEQPLVREEPVVRKPLCVEYDEQTLLDQMLESPLNKVACQSCKKLGNRRISGRLINFDVEQWVHANCAVFSDEVQET